MHCSSPCAFTQTLCIPDVVLEEIVIENSKERPGKRIPGLMVVRLESGVTLAVCASVRP